MKEDTIMPAKLNSHEYVIFSIDNVSDVHALAKFLRHIDTQEHMGKMKGKMKLLTGSYKGAIEYSFMLRQEDFEAFVEFSGYIKDQESILVYNGNTDSATLIMLKDYMSIDLGKLVAVDKALALKADAWTYDPITEEYFICI